MKTWWNYGFLIVLAIIVPFLIGVLPTIQVKSVYLGGGPVRQFAVNAVAQRLPPDVGNKMVNYFMAGTPVDEMLLYLPIAFNVSAFTLLFVFCFGTVAIETSNFIKNRVYQSQRQKAKGI